MTQKSDATDLVQVVYHSRATATFQQRDVHGMIHGAQQRNAAEGLSGLVVFDQGRFYQWLEGPARNVRRVLGSINNDGRHNEIRILSDRGAQARSFDGWDMRLGGAMRDGAAGDVLHLPTHAIKALRDTPDRAGDILSAFSPSRRAPRPLPEREIQRILRQVILDRVVPELLDRRRPPRRHEPVPGGGTRDPLMVRPATAAPSPHAATLAHRLAAGDTAAAAALLAAAVSRTGRLVPALAELAEPAARHLGDLWANDALDEAGVTLGLCCLRSSIHAAAAAALPDHPVTAAPRVLCAVQPGEPHALGTTLHAEAMWHSGWNVTLPPAMTQEALLDTLAAERFDCLDLSLSAVRAGPDAQQRVARTITLARHASRNPGLAVVVGGRAPDAARTGADGAVTSCLDLLATIRQAVMRRAA